MQCAVAIALCDIRSINKCDLHYGMSLLQNIIIVLLLRDIIQNEIRQQCVFNLADD